MEFIFDTMIGSIVRFVMYIIIEIIGDIFLVLIWCLIKALCIFSYKQIAKIIKRIYSKLNKHKKTTLISIL